MAEQLDSMADDEGGGAAAGSEAGMPRWVKVSAVLGVVAALLVAALVLVGGGEHGPGRHLPSGGDEPESIVTDGAAGGGGHDRPMGGHE
jgi:hypothetical protein